MTLHQNGPRGRGTEEKLCHSIATIQKSSVEFCKLRAALTHHSLARIVALEVAETRVAVVGTCVMEREKPRQEAVARVARGAYPEIDVGDDGVLYGTYAMATAGCCRLRKQLRMADGWSWTRTHPRKS